MASSRTQSAHSASNPDNSPNNTTTTTAPHHLQGAAIISDAIAAEEVLEKKPALIDPPFDYMNSKEEIEKFKKYEADYTRRLKAKYFSDKTIFGGNIFDEKITIHGLTIKASKWPGTKSYADPLNFEDQSSGSSTSLMRTPTSTPNEKQSMKSS